MDESFSTALIAFLEKWEEAVEENGVHAKYYVPEAAEELDKAFDKFVAAAIAKRMNGGGG